MSAWGRTLLMMLCSKPFWTTCEDVLSAFPIENNIVLCLLYIRCTEWCRKKCINLMHHPFATVCSRITWLSQKCSEKITVYYSMQNLYRLVKYSLIVSRNRIHVMSNVTLHVSWHLWHLNGNDLAKLLCKVFFCHDGLENVASIDAF